MLVLALFTGIVWLLDKLFFAKRRAATRQGRRGSQPSRSIVDYSRSLFPVLLFVLVPALFVAEPFRIPSESMMPNLLVGDFILVNKFAYGLRLPVINKQVHRHRRAQARRRGGVPLSRAQRRRSGDGRTRSSA